MKPSAEMIQTTAVTKRLLIGAAACLFSIPAWCASISASAFDKAGAALQDVVVYATPVGMAAPASPAAETLAIAQQDMQFTPYVTPIRVGSKIRFPNYDNMEHHVKSFSPTKEFEFKLYDKVTPPPVAFDKAGIVVVYCLLHEWMRAYVLIVDTPYFSKTNATGMASLDSLPEGSYEIRAWHPDMGSVKPALLQTLTVSDKATMPVKFNFDFVPRKRKAAKRPA